MRRIHSSIATPNSNPSAPAWPGARWRSPRWARLRAGLLGLLLLIPVWLPGQTTRYWDRNGALAGAGGAAPAGTWSGGGSHANWNADPAGGGSGTVSWVADDDAVFSAGTDATGSFLVTVGTTLAATQSVNSVTVEEGTVTFGGLAKIALTGKTGNNGTAKFEVKAGASAISSVTGAGYLTGTNGLNKLGGGVLWMGSTEYYKGNTYIDAGLCYMTTHSGTTDKTPFGTNSSGPTMIYIQNGAGIVASTNAAGTAVILPSFYTVSLGATGGGMLGAVSGLDYQVEARITGAGSLVINGAPGLTGTVAVRGAADYAGGTTVSNGTLLVSSALGSGAVTVEGGTLAGNGTIGGAVTVNAGGTLSPGASIGALTITNDLTLRGNTLIEVDRDAGTNDFVGGVKLLTAGGTVTVSNLGSPVEAGDTFRVFSANTYSGSFTVSGAGVSWVLTNGVLAVVGGGRPTLHVAQTNSVLTFSWAGSFKLQAQTNETGIKLGDANWFDYSNGSTSPVNVTIAPANPSVFFRLSSP